MKLPKKAIITAAGSGTRFLPATKAQPKEMLPIIDKPIIQYCVEEVVDAGVEDVIIVTKKGGHATENHFDDNFELEHQLEAEGKTDYLEKIKKSSSLANFIFLRQRASMPYGNATPLLIAKDLVDDAPFYYLFGDDITLADKSVCKQLTEVYEKNPDAALVAAAYEVPDSEVHRYGVAKIKEGTENEVEMIVEKPRKEDAPSNLVVFGRFLCTPKILPHIENLKKGQGGELWFTDAMNALAKEEKVLVHKIQGKWLTTGDPLNHFKTSVEFILDRDDLKDEALNYLKKRIYEEK